MGNGAICKLCKAPFASYDKLKSHWRNDHQTEYVRVQTWLADVDEAIVVAECVIRAQESGVDPREVRKLDDGEV
jgi:hypothetical protein